MKVFVDFKFWGATHFFIFEVFGFLDDAIKYLDINHVSLKGL